MTAHAKLSASSSHRWVNCPASIRACEGIPNKSSPAADEGTLAHQLAELALLNGKPTHDYVGQSLVKNSDMVVTTEMADYVQEYVDYVLIDKGELRVESRVHFDEWVPDGFGTCDALVITDTHLKVIDLKYGKGVPVDAYENTQGVLYALGAYSELEMIYPIESITIVIHQPRLDAVSEWSISVDELLKWGERIKTAAELALSDDAPFNAGDYQCRWCPAKATCVELKRVTDKAVMSHFDEIEDELTSPDRLNDQALRLAMENKKLIISWLDAVETVINERLQDGGTFEGFKLVAGRSNRKWQDDETEVADRLIELLDEDAFTKKLITPPQAEKLLGKKRLNEIQDLIVKPEGKPTLVPESDPRPSINITLDDFD